MVLELTALPRQAQETETATSPLGEELLTIREVAQALRVDDTTVRRWIKQGILEAISLPHRGLRQAYRVRRSTLGILLTSGSRTTEL